MCEGRTGQQNGLPRHYGSLFGIPGESMRFRRPDSHRSRRPSCWMRVVQTFLKLVSPVQTSTIHGAQGLEWPYVFVVGVTDGLLPDRREKSAADLRAEANAMYVAVTRASTKLTFVHAPTAIVVGRQSRKLQRLSRFIDKPKVLAKFYQLLARAGC